MKSRTFDALLTIFGIILMIAVAAILSFFVQTDVWYLQGLMFLAVPLTFVLWYLLLCLIDIIVWNMKKTSKLKREDQGRKDDYNRHRGTVSSDLEFTSQHNFIKLTMLEEQRDRNETELDAAIRQTEADIEQKNKQLKELKDIKTSYSVMKPKPAAKKTPTKRTTTKKTTKVTKPSE